MTTPMWPSAVAQASTSCLTWSLLEMSTSLPTASPAGYLEELGPVRLCVRGLPAAEPE